ncbi:MAG: hypothetical protein OMM_07664 [Candidatus Magnetoglobus multicellularis str. Araruama]|uniref:DUF4911 domain-containing protein n=1 Tax=Candidatus Magnetoglobus multicellularis str. Araruama TaxID=890399 RepID=A0A1V1PBL0_9BACT|nr:MAG: hypothetical protein OMM_07664 [Candidatus Magnetoglobus multicellularis str. Araruama]
MHLTKKQTKKAEFPLQTRKQLFRIHRNHICFVRFILEAYDGIALMRTLDAKKGIVEIMTAPGCADEVDEILVDLRHQIPIVQLSD